VGEEKTVLEIANWICQAVKDRDLSNEEIEFVDYHSARPGHDKRYALAGEKMKQLGWIPPVDLEKSIKKTVKWTLENQKWLSV
jgi:dTDP-glucose 4,6-dehydratase